VRSLVEHWIHVGYSRDLQSLGYKPYKQGKAFDSYLLTHEDWASFRDLYDPPPRFYPFEPCELGG
jgi:hypothetical protein